MSAVEHEARRTTAERAGSTDRHRFGRLLTAAAASNLADGVVKLALPVAAARLTTSPGLVAGVATTAMLPWLLFALPAGALVDRLDRRRTILAAHLLRVTALVLLVAAIGLGLLRLPLLYLLALVLGIAETFADTADAALVPAVVPRGELERANARLLGVQTVTNGFIGPLLGGMLAAAGLGLAFGAGAGLYLAAAGALLLLRGSFRAPPTPRTRLHREIAEGIRVVARNRLLAALALIVAVMNISWSAWLAVLVVYVVAPGPVGLSEWGYGVLLTAIGIGGVLGTLLAAPMQRWIGRRWMIGADIAGTFAMLAVPALTTSAWAIGAAAVVGGIGSTLWGVVVVTLRQRTVPDALQGRVSGVFRLCGYGAMALGAALAGVVAELAGVRAVFAGCAALTLLLVVPFHTAITGAALASLDTPAGHEDNVSPNSAAATFRS